MSRLKPSFRQTENGAAPTQKTPEDKSVMETILFSREDAKAWILPPFQRNLTHNGKLMEVADLIKRAGGVIPGVLTMGILQEKKFLVDGQHRREAFLLADLADGMADVRTIVFESMEDMAAEFVRLNSRIVVMKPDDILRAMESSSPTLQQIRESCSFVGYANIRRNERAPILSMSQTLRSWRASSLDIPSTCGPPVATVPATMPEEEVDLLCRFLKVAFKAWGRDEAYVKLWNACNLAICMWIWRRIVVSQYSAKSTRIDDEQYCKCLMSLSADDLYLSWIVGRSLGDRDRGPTYNRIKTIFCTRLQNDTGKKHILPAPEWAPRSGSRP